MPSPSTAGGPRMSASPWPDASDTALAAARPGRLATMDRPGRVVAVRGVHGGAGATTVAAHLAGAWARWGPSPVGLLDLAGGLAHRLDLAPGVRTWTDLAGLADEPDDQALAGALTQPSPDLWVLPLTGLVDGGRAEPAPDPALVRAVLAAGRRVWRVVVVDLPPAAGPQVDAALGLAEVLLAVGRCHSAGVRGTRAALDLWAAAGRDLEDPLPLSRLQRARLGPYGRTGWAWRRRRATVAPVPARAWPAGRRASRGGPHDRGQRGDGVLHGGAHRPVVGLGGGPAGSLVPAS